METAVKHWTTVSLIQWSAEYLREKGFDNSRLEAERLLAHVLGFSRIQLYLQHDRPLNAEELSRFKLLFRKRLEHCPLQYLIGETEFMSLPMTVSPAVLIPRPETEVLVERARQICQSEWGDGDPPRVLDIGTGSGAIAVALAHYQPQIHLTAIDQSAAALEVARQNAARHHLEDRIEFILQDMTSPWPASCLNSFDLVLSNPPYISEREFPELAEEIRRYEPRSALVAQQDGLEHYCLFARLLPALLRPRGIALLEIGADMAAAAQLCFSASPFKEIVVLQDLAGKDRVLELRIGER
ncbi:MAG TPA: peptide chain release factor N(5)-glutamine methyltransferase [bacterium]|nr:peptide chain release factor N(5)-glutamine methyltransferase [bacterium]